MSGRAVTVMGHVVSNAMRLIGLSRTPRIDAELRKSVEHLTDLTAKSPQLTDRERLHVKAVQQLADGYRRHAFITTPICYNSCFSSFLHQGLHYLRFHTVLNIISIAQVCRAEHSVVGGD